MGSGGPDTPVSRRLSSNRLQVSLSAWLVEVEVQTLCINKYQYECLEQFTTMNSHLDCKC